MQEPITKVALLDTIAQAYNEFEKLLSPLTEAQMVTPMTDTTWSIKDTIAHLNIWQQRLVEYLQAAAQGRQPLNLPGNLDDEQINQENEQHYQENRSRALASVLQTFRTTHILVVGAIQALTDDDLTDTRRFPWMHGTALWQVIAGDTYEHYQEHGAVILSSLK